MSEAILLPEEIQIIAEKELNEVPQRVEQDISKPTYFSVMTFLPDYGNGPLLFLVRAENANPDIMSVHDMLKMSTLMFDVVLQTNKATSVIGEAILTDFKNVSPRMSHISKLPEELQIIAKTELNEVPERIEEDITHIRTCSIAILPQILNKPMWILFRVENLTTEMLSTTDLIKFSTMVTDVTLREWVSSTVVGRAVLIDLKNLSPTFLTLITPTFIKQYLTCHLSAYPLRLKAVHMMNVSAIMVSVLNVLKMLLPKKLKDRITYDTIDRETTILQYLPLSVLPTEYGGTAGPFADMCEKFYAQIKSYRDWFVEEEQYGCDESKRPATSKVDIDLFSIDGSFRKLHVD
ncbi:hypothetical protein FQR65_LT17354 [Abscondita terminalis]|nr:hypothetical protein FQR65_LT17354 [Abscondita terminalis]